jgi:cytochrome P450
VVSNTTALIARSPEAREAVATDPSCLRTCVEETLRFEPPVHRTGRIAQEDITFNGVPFQKGERLSLLLGAANRDPGQFTNPNHYQYDRHPNRHLAFSMGRHFCVGAHLARIQATVANREIFKLFPNLSIDETGIEWRPNLSLRSMIRCPVSP